VTQYSESDSSESSDDVDELPKCKRRRVNRLWVQQQSFETLEEAKKAIQAKNIWRISLTRNTFQVTKNIEKYLTPLSKSSTVKKVKEDIRTLQICATEDCFKKAGSLFLKKWCNSDALATNFLNYFNKQRLQKLPYWYEGAALGFPSTNNSVEGTNAVIK